MRRQRGFGGFLREMQINAQTNRTRRARRRPARQTPARQTQPLGGIEEPYEVPYGEAELGPEYQNYYSYSYPEGFYGNESTTSGYEGFEYEGTPYETNQRINIPGRPPVGP